MDQHLSKLNGVTAPIQNNTRTFKISTGDTVRGGDILRKTVNWDQIADRLSQFSTANIDIKDYRGLGTEDRARFKNSYGYYLGGHYSGSTRKKSEIVAKTLITLDCDFLDPWDIDDLRAVYAPWTHVSHSSMSYSEDDPKLRLVFPVDRDMSLMEFEAVSRMVASFYDIHAVDAVSFRPNQLMYWPAKVADVEPLYWRSDAQILSVDEVLEMYDDWRDFETWPKSKREKPLRNPATAAEDPRTKPGVIGAFCRSYSIHDVIAEFDLPYRQSGDDDDRYTPDGSEGGAGAIVYNDGLFLYSHHSNDPAADQNLNAFDLVRRCLFSDLDANAGDDCPLGSLPSQKEMLAMAHGCKGVMEDINDTDGSRAESILDELEAVPEEPTIADTGSSTDLAPVEESPPAAKPTHALSFDGLLAEIGRAFEALPHRLSDGRVDAPKTQASCQAIVTRIAAAKLDPADTEMLAVALQPCYPLKIAKATIIASIKKRRQELT